MMLRVTPRMTILPALVGGIISGMLTGFPFVNIPCLLWMLLGGAAAAYFLMLNQGDVEHVSGRVPKRYGVEVGAVSGLIGASIAMVISLFMAVNFADLIAGGIAGISDAGTAGIIAQVVTTDPNLNIASLVVKYVVMLVSFPVFGALGGYLVARFMR